MKKLDPSIDRLLENLTAFEYDLKKVKEIEDFRAIAVKSVETRDVITFKCKPKTGSMKMVPLYDIHYGLKNCNEAMLDAYLKYILNTEDCYTFIGGDSCETATRDSVGLSTFEETLHCGEQRRALTDKLRPLAEAGKILGAITGNHEMRVQRWNEDNPMTEICYDLKIPYCEYSTFLDLYVNDINYHVFISHGAGSASTPGGKANAAAKGALSAFADLYLSGHTHDRNVHERRCRVVENGMEVTKRQLFIGGGSLVNYFGSYAEEKMLAPSVVGLVLLTFNGDVKYIGQSF